MTELSRYHPVLVAFHWLIAVMIVSMLAFGFAWIAQQPSIDRQMIGALSWHMAGGAVIFLLMACRFIARLWTEHPTKASIGHRWLDRLASLSHFGFYVLILLITATGVATALLSNLAGVALGGSADAIPSTLMPYPTFAAHALLATALAILIVVHILAALYHQFFKKDDLLKRMSFSGGKQSAGTEVDRHSQIIQ